MQSVPEVINTIGHMPIEHVLGLIALAAVALSAFAIYAVSSLAKNRDRK